MREAVGPEIAIKVDVNQGWRSPGTAIAAIRAMAPSLPAYVEQPVLWWDMEGLAEVRRQTGAIIMIDEGCHGPRDMLRAVALRAADLVNIKLMKSGGILNALKLNAIAEAAGIPAQVGTMVESSIASAAGLHAAIAMTNVTNRRDGRPFDAGGGYRGRSHLVPSTTWSPCQMPLGSGSASTSIACASSVTAGGRWKRDEGWIPIVSDAVWIAVVVSLGVTQALQIALLAAMNRARGPAEAAYISILGTLAGLTLALTSEEPDGISSRAARPVRSPRVDRRRGARQRDAAGARSAWAPPGATP